MSSRRMTSNELRSAGIAALQEALGPADALRFLRMFDRGSGDYTAERERILGDVTLEELGREIEEHRTPSTK